MSDVNETQLPGVGLRYDFGTRAGRQLGVLVHRTGRRELFVYADDDPDAVLATVRLDELEARTLADLLGTSRIAEHLSELHQQVEGLAMDWIRVEAGGEWTGLTLAEAGVHTATGVSIVAITRDGQTIPAPHSSERLLAGDVAIGIGTAQGVADTADRLRPAS